MKLKVTKAITSHGTYYAAGSVVEMDPAVAGSFVRLYGWVPVPKGQPDLSSLKKAELVAKAEDAGFDVPASATKQDIINLLK